MMTRRNSNPCISINNRQLSVHDIVGAGSFSNVYRATFLDTKRNIALKVFKRNPSDVNQYSRIGMEIALVKILNHPNIISFVICEISKTDAYLGMEFSPHGSLFKVLREKKLLSETYIQILMKQLLSALDYLHSRSICHGDVKPENVIMFDFREPVVKLADFGLSDVLMNTEKEASRGGSFYYKAPELHLKFPFDVTIDLWSAGVVMYELLFKQLPFNQLLSKEQHITFLRKRTEIVKTGDESRPRLSKECFDLLTRLLDYDKHQRPRGEILRKHPFLNITNQTPDYQNYYIKGCQLITDSFDLLQNHERGKAIITANEGLLHLKIYCTSVKQDKELFSYLQFRIAQYSEYCKQIIQGEFNSHTSPITSHLNEDTLRTTLFSTTNLLTGYDICCIGEMYVNQHKFVIGLQKLSEGLDIILKHLDGEPPGERKRLLIKKVKEWVSLLEKLKFNSDITGTG